MIAVIFEVQIATSKQGQYLSLASSWWKNEDAILQWKNNILHSKAQQEGKKSIFDFYKISIVKLERCYEFTSTHT
ncbi:antibiotic biosynthesis monooxygenase [Proteus mirabilis]|nr:antibiotic biosynthesis monooxygenase [Proteus mirabilis]